MTRERARRTFDLVVAGELNPDIIVTGEDTTPEFGQVERLVDGIRLTIGSSSAITACGAARLGLKVAFVGVVGEDPFGRWMLDALAARGVDVAACRTDGSIPTGASVILANPNDRAILTSIGAIAELSGADLPDALLAQTHHLHVGSLFLQDRLRGDLTDVFRRARALGVTTSFDPNWDPTGTWDGGIRPILETTDVVLPNREEAYRMTDVEEDGEAGRRLAASVPVVAIKLGAEGGLVVTGDRATMVDAPRVDVIDAIGAGDAFDAGFLLGWLDGRAPTECLQLAVACGSLSVRAVGGTDGQPEPAEAKELAARLVARSVTMPSASRVSL